MGLSRISSNMPDWRDVAAAMEEIERTWQQAVKILVLRTGTGKFREILLTAEMVEDHDESGAVRPSAYVQSSLRGSNIGVMEAELLLLLYRLDFVRSELQWSVIPEEA